MEQEKYPTPEIGPEKEILKKEYSEIEEKPKKPWLKITSFCILGLVLVGSLVFAGYKFRQKQILSGVQPIPTPTITPEASESPANWKTYTNPIGKYSIKIPEEFNIEEMSGSGFSVGINEAWFRTDPDVDKTFFISVSDLSDPKQKVELKAKSSDQQISEVIVDGVYGKRLIEDDRVGGGWYIQQLIFENKSRGIFIYYSAKSQSLIALFDKILSTLHFLD